MARWTKEQQILIDIGRREFKQEVVGIIKKHSSVSGKHWYLFPNDLLKEIESKKED